MADPADGKKKSKHPYGAIFWGVVGAAAAFRALYHPWRTLVKDGFPSHCAGENGCDPAMTITSFAGLTEIYSPVRAQVAIAKTGTILLIPDDEAVVLELRGADTTTFLQQVHSGDHVGAGQQIGLSSQFTFAVWQLLRNAQGQAVMGKAIEPASWLATHGAKISAKYHSSTGATWCANGRKLVVPQTIASQCGMVLPPPSGYALLPVSVTMA
jgi:hypothetical protein